MRRRRSPAETAAILKMYREGRKVVDIATIVKTSASEVSRTAKAAGLPLRQHQTIANNAARDAVIVHRYMNEPKTSIKQLSADFGISSQRIVTIALNGGAPPRHLSIKRMDTNNSPDGKSHDVASDEEQTDN